MDGKNKPGFRVYLNNTEMRYDDIKRDVGSLWCADDGSVWIITNAIRCVTAESAGWAHEVREATEAEAANLADKTEVDWNGFFDATAWID
jgi:hypothetical protein